MSLYNSLLDVLLSKLEIFDNKHFHTISIPFRKLKLIRNNAKSNLKTV